MTTRRTNPDFLNGVPELLILSLLAGRPMYGYELVQAIRQSTQGTLEFGEGCVYPVLHRLEAEGRMDGAGRRVVRAGDAMTWTWGVADPALRAAHHDLPHIAHTAMRVVLRRGAGPEVESSTAPAAVAVDGVHAVLSFAAAFQQGLDCDLYWLEGDAADVTRGCRTAAPYPDEAEVLLDAPFALVVPFDYSFADRIRASDLPPSID